MVKERVEAGKWIAPSWVAVTKMGKKIHTISARVDVVEPSGLTRRYNGDTSTIREGEHLELCYSRNTKCGMFVEWEGAQADGDYGALAVKRTDPRAFNKEDCSICVHGWF